MNVSEIITNPPRDEYIDQHESKLKETETIAKIKGLRLKKLQSSTEIEYGLFDDKLRLVGYFSLEYRGKNIWEVTLVQLAQAYKGQGFGTFFYDYAVMNDKLYIMSDATQTGGPHGSKDLWKRLKENNRYQVIGYNKKTNEKLPDATEDEIYDETPDLRWLCIPPKESINECITRIQSTMKKQHLVWYGPGTSTPTYFNF